MDPITGLFLFGLYKATEKVWDKTFDAALDLIKDAIKAKGKEWAGKGSEDQLQEAITNAAIVAREFTLVNADDRDLTRQVLNVLADDSHQDLLLTLAEEGRKLLSSLKKPDVRRLTAHCQEHLKWEAIYGKAAPPDTGDVAEVVAELLAAMREALTDQPAFQHLIAKEQRDYLREIRDTLVSTPQYATEDDYRAQVIAVDGNLDFTGIAVARRRDAVRVDSLFAHLNLKSEITHFTYIDTSEGSSFKNETAQENIIRGREAEDLIRAMLDVSEALRQGRSIVILGDPGSGKTTLLKYLAIKASLGETAPEFGLDTPPYLPIFATLRGFAAEANRPQDYGLLDYFHTQAHERYSLDLPPDFFKNALSEKRCLVLLDGLDEVWQSGHRAEVRDVVRALVNRYAGNRFVITSRITGYEAASLDRRTYLHYVVQPLGDEEIKTFVRTWYTLREPEAKQREELTKGLIDALESRPDILDLARNPLLLTIIALVHRNEADLPQDRAMLYGKCVQTLLEDWEGKKRLSPAEKSRPYYNHRLDLLQLLAYDLHVSAEQPRQLQSISRDELENKLAKYLHEDLGLFHKPRLARPDAQSFVQFITTRNGLLIERGQNEFSFPHLTFQEYLAAVEIDIRTYGDPEKIWGIVKDHLHESHWREVLLLLMGMLGKSRRGWKSTKLVEHILQAGQTDPYEDILHRHLFLATAVCADRVSLAADLIQTIVDRLFTLALESNFSELRYDALDALGSLKGNKQAVDGLLAIPRDNLVAARGKRNAAIALWQLGHMNEAVDFLLALANDEQVDAYTRSDVAQALGQLGRTEDAVVILLGLARDEQVDALVRSIAAQELNQLGRTDDAVAILLGLARDEQVDALVRSVAAKRVGELGRTDDAVLEALITIASDEQVGAYERSAAAQALGQLGRTDDAVTILLALVRDEQVDASTRCDAAKALSQLGRTDDAVMILLALARDEQVNALVHISAAQALGQLGRTEGTVLEVLLTLARDEQVDAVDAIVRIASAQALGQLGRTDDAVTILLAIACDEQVGTNERNDAYRILKQLLSG